jgi:hypothetical protein
MKEREMSTEVKKKNPWRMIAAATILLSGAGIIGQSVLATLNSTAFNEVARDVSSGTLNLTLTDNGVGFSQNISNMAPGDVVNRYINLENEGSLDGKSLTLKTTQNGDETLISDGVNGSSNQALRLTVLGCSVAWDSANGTCGGTETTEIASTALGAFTTPKSFSNGVLTSNENRYLKLSIQLPNQNETTSNGNFPANTVQGKSVAVTYTFDLIQRDSVTTNS